MGEAQCEQGATGQSAQTNTGTLRAATLIEVSEPDLTRRWMIAFASERGYDRIVELANQSVGMNTEESFTFTKFAFEDMVRGGAMELRIEVMSASSWTTCDGETGGETKETLFGVCGLDRKGEPYCIGFVPRTSVTVDSTYDHASDTFTYGRARRFALDVRLVGHTLVVKRKSGRVPEGYRGWLGTHSVSYARRHF